jgi:phosphoribosyl 1,2-cyclic phosphodiesterase
MMPKRAILMHMNHTADYNVLKDACDPGTEPAFDGMIVVC